MTRMIVLAGAPEPNKLDWNEKLPLPNSTHIETATTNPSCSPLSPTSKAFGAQWRQMTTQRLQMRPILPKLNIDARPPPENFDPSGADFFSADEHAGSQTPGSDVSCNESQPSGNSSETTSEALSEYYEHSFAIHEAVPSSQISAFSSYTPGTPTYESSEEMFPQTPGGGIIRTPSQRRLSQAPRPKHLSDLDDIPNARYLTSIEPQTMTVNLIVGILSISPARTVITGTRYGRPRETELVEMVVGDETKTGFSISMWLPREMHVNWKDGAKATPEGSRSVLRRSLRFMRPRDVVLLQNVALSSFRGKVHGQSLKGDVTKIDLLFRKKVDDDDISGIYTMSNLRMAKDPQVLKVKRVKDWMMDFVGDRDDRARAAKGRQRGRTDYGFLPDDTP